MKNFRNGQFVLTTDEIVVASDIISRKEFNNFLISESLMNFKTLAGNHVNLFPAALRKNSIHFVFEEEGVNPVIDFFDDITVGVTSKDTVQIVILTKSGNIVSKVMSLSEAHALLNKAIAVKYLSFPSPEENLVVLYSETYEVLPIYFINCDKEPLSDLYDESIYNFEIMDRKSLIKFIKEKECEIDYENMDTRDIRSLLNSIFNPNEVIEVPDNKTCEVSEVKEIQDVSYQKIIGAAFGNMESQPDGFLCKEKGTSVECIKESIEIIESNFENAGDSHSAEDDNPDSWLARADVLAFDKNELVSELRSYLEDCDSDYPMYDSLNAILDKDASELVLRNLFLREIDFLEKSDFASMNRKDLLDYLITIGFSIKDDDSTEDLRSYAEELADTEKYVD